MEDMYEAIDREVKEQIQLMVESSRIVLNASNVGLNTVFDKTNHRELTLSTEAREKLIYPDVLVYTDDKNYFIVKDTYVVYPGHVDAEGIQETIESDILTLPDFINMTMATAAEDTDALYTMFTDIDFILKYQKQMLLGLEKGQANGHY